MFFNLHTIVLRVLFQKSVARRETFLLVSCLIYMLQYILEKPQVPSLEDNAVLIITAYATIPPISSLAVRDVIQLFTPGYKSLPTNRKLATIIDRNDMFLTWQTSFCK